MKKIICVILILAVIFSMAACMGKDQKTVEELTNTTTIQEASKENSVDSTEATGQQTTESTQAANSIEEGTAENKTGDTGNGETQLLQSASVDLDNDGKNEEIEALQVKSGEESDGGTAEVEGVLKITSKSGILRVPFIKKQAGMSGVMTSFEFRDLDGDGSKEVFIIIPDTGASFSLNYFFVYNYKTGESYSFSSDYFLSEFANGFVFRYKGGGKLEMSNDSLGFKGVFDISKDSGFESKDENNYIYENSWVEPTPVEIDEEARIALIKASDGVYEIKVPLPVFGLATVDMIGEIDLFYRMDSKSGAVLKHFVAYDFEEGKKEEIGGWRSN